MELQNNSIDCRDNIDGIPLADIEEAVKATDDAFKNGTIQATIEEEFDDVIDETKYGFVSLFGIN